MVAEIIVDNHAKQVDKVFDYAVPENLEDSITVGSRVIVPFSGGNNRVEGFCMRIKDKTDAKRLKSIIKMSDMPRAFDEEMLLLIEWMRNKYLASYLDIIHTIVPSGTNVRGNVTLSLKNPHKSTSDTINQIQKLIHQNGGKMEQNALQSYFQKSIAPQIRTMISQGVLEKEYSYHSAISKKTHRALRLKIDRDKLPDVILKTQKRAGVQAKVLEQFLDKDEVILSDLSKISKSAQSAVNALIKKGLIEAFDKEINRNPLSGKSFTTSGKYTPTNEQSVAIREISNGIDSAKSGVYLLHGVTGSGKTEVFLQTIEHCIENNKTALVLVPEISLTPQMVNRFVSRFGKRVAILHSGLSLGERFDQWQIINEGNADIVIGARSAVFAPLKNIGVIIIDEEHSDTYKSEMSPRYETREVAIKRAELLGATVVLASATPSTESMFRAKSGDYTLLTMNSRYNNNRMPDIKIVDMREELKTGNKSMLSRSLYNELSKNLKNKEQTILFLNRRGFSTFVSCRSCGYVAKCPNCSITLTYHKFEDSLKCHYCGYTHKNYTVCPSCQSKYIRYFGVGTQRVEAEVKRLFPDASVLRMDVDTMGKKESHDKILSKFVNDKTDILIGTQMVAKGLDFENVTLVGVISADTMLNISDYRSSERTFSMLCQVCGRAGRGKKPGRAIVQTYSPDNEAISLVKTHDYNRFYDGEIVERKLMWYPPYSQIVAILFSGTSKNLVANCTAYFRKFLVDLGQRTQILGPVPDGLAKINNKYRYRIIIKCEDYDKLNGILLEAQKACKTHDNYKNVVVVIDKNPNML
ncbi:MAG: primosomal protein N' [Clostridia bacterium]|nr:primosomal protein N' [Clostridia bacterium]